MVSSPQKLNINALDTVTGGLLLYCFNRSYLVVYKSIHAKCLKFKEFPLKENGAGTYECQKALRFEEIIKNSERQVSNKKAINFLASHGFERPFLMVLDL